MPPTHDDAVHASTASQAIAHDDVSATSSAVRARTPPIAFGTRTDGVSLSALVQQECAARSERIVRIASQGYSGYLFFKNGQIVHATTKDAAGETAARTILGWSEGTFEPCRISWPECLTITQPWQNLLPFAPGKREPSRVVPVPPKPPWTRDRSERERTSSIPERGATQLERAVRVDATGSLLSKRGDAEALGGLTAYVTRLAELIGDAIGLDKFMALDLELEASRCVVFVEQSGNVVAVQAKNGSDLNTVAKRAGL